MTNLDYDAVNLTPTARRLIEELVKEVQEYKNRINDVKELKKTMWAGTNATESMRVAISILEGESYE